MSLREPYGRVHIPGFAPGMQFLAYFVSERPQDQFQTFRNGDHSRQMEVVPYLRRRLDVGDAVMLVSRERYATDPWPGQDGGLGD